MCKDGKCQARGNEVRSTLVSLGIAARAMARLSMFPQMVVKTPLYIAIVNADPDLRMIPGLMVIMEVYSTSTDIEVTAKADRFIEDETRVTEPAKSPSSIAV